MTKPFENKSPEMINAIEAIFPGTKAAIAANLCASCKGPIGPFKNEKSKREYTISGLCQKCQDEIFG